MENPSGSGFVVGPEPERSPLAFAMTIGRIVLFCLSNGELRPAIVTRVHTQERVNIAIIPDMMDEGGRIDCRASVKMWNPSDWNESPTPGTWHWPPRG